MDQLLQHILNATILGGTYALLGIGLTLIFGIMRVVNFMHGELYTFGAYMLYMFVMALGVNFFLGLVLAVILGVLLGALIEFVLLRPIRGADIARSRKSPPLFRRPANRESRVRQRTSNVTHRSPSQSGAGPRDTIRAAASAEDLPPLARRPSASRT